MSRVLERETPAPSVHAVSPAAPRRWLVAAAVAFGVAATGVYACWWIVYAPAYGWAMLPVAAFVAFYAVAQLYCAWFLYLHVAVPHPAAPPEGGGVDVFVPVFDEPAELVERTLRAAVAMHGAHRTWLLDDARHEQFAEIAARAGAGYLRRDDHAGAKAGNVNAALARTEGAFVTVFDVDHVPDPDFLEVALAHASDPSVGFVQSGVAFRNREESFIARATVDQAVDIYGPTSMGMYGSGAALVWGSHTTFRRAALASIGGYQTSLAEDLLTSMRLHAAGWRSVYVPSVHARGLVPSDLRSLTKQQLKWARGVFGVLVEAFPALAKRMAVSQSAAYLVRLTYYLIGPLFLLHALAVLAVLLAGDAGARLDFARYLASAAPLGAAVLLVRAVTNRVWNPQRAARGVNPWGYALACALWPVYTVALVCAVLRVPIPHLATPKERNPRPRPLLALPQMVLLTALLAAIGVQAVHGFDATTIAPVSFAAAVAAVQLVVIVPAVAP